MKYDTEYPKHSPEENAEFRQSMGGGDQVIVLGSTHAPEEELLLKKLEGKRIWLVPRHPDRAPSLKKYATENVTIVDKMGMLLRCYECCDVAIVGGSFVEGIGGHNILEPLAYGKPTFFGPHMENQFELVELVKKHGAAKQITLDELPEVLDQKVGQLTQTLSGASEKTLNTISLLSTMKQKD